MKTSSICLFFATFYILSGCVTDGAKKYSGGYQGTFEVDRSIAQSNNGSDHDLFFQSARLSAEFGGIAQGISYAMSIGQAHADFADQSGDTPQQEDVKFTLTDTTAGVGIFFNRPWLKIGTRIDIGSSQLSHELTDEEVTAILAEYEADPSKAGTTPSWENDGTRYRVTKYNLLSRFSLLKTEYGSLDMNAYLAYGRYVGRKHCNVYETCGDAFSDYDEHSVMSAGAGVSLSLTETPMRFLGYLILALMCLAPAF